MFYKGLDIDLENRENWVAVIGSRKANEKELKTAYALGKKLAQKGKIVVSGLAEGIDTEAHKGALDGGGKTIAILSTTIEERIYPYSNKSLADRILEQGGIIYPFTKPVDKKLPYNEIEKIRVNRLRERDILVAYLTSAIIPVKEEDDFIKGGTRWAVYYGIENFNKEVHRIDTNGKFHKDPKVYKAILNWTMELDIYEKIVKR